jgi:hypothetical protein
VEDIDMTPRKWVPDINMFADQLIADYSDNPEDSDSQGFLDALNTVTSWQETAADHGEEITEGDWIKLACNLAQRIALDKAGL